MRDITNSAKAGSRVFEAFPSRNSVPEPLKKRATDTKPFIESKLKITDQQSDFEPEPAILGVCDHQIALTQKPKTIVELLALPDDLLPDVEYGPVAMNDNSDDFEDLPLIETDLGNKEIKIIFPVIEQKSKTVLGAAERGRKALQVTVDKAMQKLIIESNEFSWASEKINLPDDESESTPL